MIDPIFRRYLFLDFYGKRSYHVEYPNTSRCPTATSAKALTTEPNSSVDLVSKWI